MPDPERFSLTVDGAALAVEVRRKRVRNVNARLAGSTLCVSAPALLPRSELEPIVVELARRLIRRVRAREINGGEGLVRRAARIAARFPRPPGVKRLEFSTVQRSRWGSYSAATGTIRLHAALREMPDWVVDAVLAHELAHAFHRRHSPAFWALARAVCPDIDRARAFLAGVSWLVRRWPALGVVERTLLAGAGEEP